MYHAGSSMYGHQSIDSIIMNEVIKTFSGENVCLGDIKGMFYAVFSKLPKILLFIAAKKCIEGSATLFEPLTTFMKSTLVSLLYRKRIFSKTDISSADFHSGRIASEKIPKIESPFPITSADIGVDLAVSYIPFFHSKYIKDIEEEGKKALEENQERRKLKISIFKVAKVEDKTIKYSKCFSNNLFPSKNYKKLTSVIKKHFKVSSKIHSNNVIGILIDGVPGPGKTKFADYAVSVGLAYNVYKIDMTKFIEIEFNLVLNLAFHRIEVENSSIFVIDEMDKYIDYRLQVNYTEKEIL